VTDVDQIAEPLPGPTPAEAVESVSTPDAPGDPGAPDKSGRSGVRGLIARFEHIIRELGKFGVVGAVSFAVDFAIYNTLTYEAHMETITAGTISMIIAATIAFVGNRLWTWRHRERTSLRREYGLYFLFNLVGLGITDACLFISHYGLGARFEWFQGHIADNIAKNIVGMALATSFRFWSYRRIVFREQRAAAE
jgi:putative flippase GtrA